MKNPIRVLSCLHCGKEKKTTRTVALYCSDACKLRHWRKRNGSRKGVKGVKQTVSMPSLDINKTVIDINETVKPKPPMLAPGIETVITLSGTMGTLKGWHTKGCGENVCWCDHCRDYYLKTGIRRVKHKYPTTSLMVEYCRSPEFIARNGGVDLNEASDKWNGVKRPTIKVVRLNNPDQAPD